MQTDQLVQSFDDLVHYLKKGKKRFYIKTGNIARSVKTITLNKGLGLVHVVHYTTNEEQSIKLKNLAHTELGEAIKNGKLFVYA